MRRFYLVTRDLHLYVGLFLSPFVLVFAVSVFYLVHGLAHRPAPGPSDPSRTVDQRHRVPRPRPPTGARQGRRAATGARAARRHGEIDFVRHVASEHRLIVPVRLPDRDTVVTIDYEQRTATVTSRDHSMGDALVYLHKMPGPHNVDVRGNSRLIALWRVLADATAYLAALHHHQRHLPVDRTQGRAPSSDWCCSWPAQSRSGGWCMPSLREDGIVTRSAASAAPPIRFSCGIAGSTTSLACTSVLHLAVRRSRDCC